MKKGVGLRTCRACHQKKEKKNLLRMVVLDKQTLEVDPRQIKPGRGWYLCRDEACLALLRSPKGLQKSFGRSLQMGPGLHTLIS
jgi:uncharacterized protein